MYSLEERPKISLNSVQNAKEYLQHKYNACFYSYIKTKKFAFLYTFTKQVLSLNQITDCRCRYGHDCRCLNEFGCASKNRCFVATRQKKCLAYVVCVVSSVNNYMWCYCCGT